MRLDLWTPDEDAELRTLALAGLSLAEISQKIGRPKTGVRSRAARLEIAIARDQNGMQKKERFKNLVPRNGASASKIRLKAKK